MHKIGSLRKILAVVRNRTTSGNDKEVPLSFLAFLPWIATAFEKRETEGERERNCSLCFSAWTIVKRGMERQW